jgi:hypothetical protein
MSADDNQETFYRVLGRGVTRKLFAKTARGLGLSKHDTWKPTGKNEAYEEVWATPDKTSAINYVEDPVSDLSYAHFRGADADRLLTEFTRRLSTFWPEELIERAYTMEEHDEQVENLYRLAITFPEYNEEVFEIFEGVATQAEQPALRLAALDAMSYHRWPQSRAVVERLAREDKDEDVRNHAKNLLTLWDTPTPSRPA